MEQGANSTEGAQKMKTNEDVFENSEALPHDSLNLVDNSRDGSGELKQPDPYPANVGGNAAEEEVVVDEGNLSECGRSERLAQLGNRILYEVEGNPEKEVDGYEFIFSNETRDIVEEKMKGHEISESEVISENVAKELGQISESDIKSKVFPETDLKSESFSETDLKDEAFPETDLKDVVFPETDLKDVVFPETDLKDVFPETDLKEEVFPESDLKEEMFPETDLKEEMFPETDLKEEVFPETDLKEEVFPETDLKEEVFPETDLKEEVFPETDLKEEVFPETDLKEEVFPETDLKEEVFPETDLKEEVFPETDLKEEVFPETDLKEEVFPETDLKEEVFPETDLKEEVFPETDLKEEVFPETDLKEEVLTETDLKEEVLTETDLKEEVFPETDLKEEAFPETDLKEEAFPETDLKEEVFPETDLKEEVFPETDLKEEVFPETDLKEEVFPETDLKEEVFPETDLKEEVFPETDLKEEVFSKKEVSFSNNADKSKVLLPLRNRESEVIPENAVKEFKTCSHSKREMKPKQRKGKPSSKNSKVENEPNKKAKKYKPSSQTFFSRSDTAVSDPEKLRPNLPLPKDKPLIRKASGSALWTSVAREMISRSVSGKDTDGGSSDRRSTSSSSSAGSPKLKRISSNSSLLGDIAQGNLDNWDPETCVTLLRIPTVTNYSGIKKLIQQASPEWLEDFLSLDGLGILFESLARHGSHRSVSISDVLLQLECVACVKTVMNSEIGLGHITRDRSYTRKLAEALGNSSMMVKQQVFELLSALCMYSESGHSLALDALNNYKVYHGIRYRFQLVVDEIKMAEVPEYQASLLAFINCIVLAEETLAARCSLRNEFLGLNLESILTVLRYCDCDSVSVQLHVFDAHRLADQDELFYSDEYQMVMNHYEMFGSLFEKIKETPQSLQLLTILQCLCKLDPSNALSDDVWSLLERICVRETEGSLKRTWSNSLVCPPVRSVASVATQTVATKLRKKEEGNKDHASTSTNANEPASVPPPPPPPPHPVSGTPPPLPPPPSGSVPPPPSSASGPLLTPPPPLPFGSGPTPPPPPPCSGPPPPPPPPGCGPLLSKGVAPALAKVTVPILIQVFSSHLPKPRSKMKRLNWSKVTSQGVGKDSVWKEIETHITDLMPSNLNFQEIEDLFCQRGIKELAGKPTSDAAKKKKKSNSEVTLLDPKTSLNVNIFLRQYKCPPDVVAAFVGECNIAQLGGDRLRGLLKILPEDSEVEIIKDYNGDRQKLGDPEKFFYRLVKIPSYKSRIEGMILMAEFVPEVNTLTPQLEKLLKCCKSLLHNDGIKHFFAYVLTLGNFINMDSYAGNAPGFKLSTIPKLWETRANQAGMTLLHYIEEKAAANDGKILEFTDELERDLVGTDRISTDGIKVEIQNLMNEVKKLKKRMEESDQDLRNHFEKFIGDCEESLKDLNLKLMQIEEYRLKLSRYYCEDESKFRLEDCLNMFLTLCTKIRDARKENQNRHEKEEKKRRRETERKKLEKEREEIKASGVNLRTKKGFIPPKESEGCVVDLLLQEIRKGNFKLRKSEEQQRVV